MPQSDIAGFHPGLSRFPKPWETVITPAAIMVTPQGHRGNTDMYRGQPGKTVTRPEGFQMFKTIGATVINRDKFLKRSEHRHRRGDTVGPPGYTI